MELHLKRFFKNLKYTLGKLYVDDELICHTLEDTDRALRQDMTLDQIQTRKMYGITAIPKGRYRVRMDRYSTKFGRRKFYKEVCDGKLPYLEDVKGFEGILIHCGNSPEDTCGCILVGENLEKGKVLKSQLTFKKLYKMLKEADDRNEEIWITID